LFWQAFAEETRGRSSRGSTVTIHCRAYATLQEAQAKILEYETYDYRKLTVFVVDAETSREAGRLVVEAVQAGTSSSCVSLIRKAG